MYALVRISKGGEAFEVRANRASQKSRALNSYLVETRRGYGSTRLFHTRVI